METYINNLTIKEQNCYFGILKSSLKWAENNNYTGYCKFDSLNSPMEIGLTRSP